MTDKNKKTLIKNTLLLIVGVAVIALYCITPKQELIQDPLETYSINFDSAGGTAIAAITIEEGSYPDQPETPTREGYIFVGWMLDDEYYDFSESVNGDITLRAVWKEVEPDKTYYTVTFDTDGGNNISSQVIEEGQPASRPPVYPVKEGYTFVGWTLNGTEYDFNSPVTSDITIVATWEENKQEEPQDPDKPAETTYTIRFNGNGGTLGSGCSIQTVKTGDLAKNTCTATRNGYTLVGFNNNSNATVSNITTRRITSNTTYYAIWRRNQTTNPVNPEPPKVTTYQLSFNPNGGDLGSNCPGYGSQRTVNEGTALSSVCTVTRAHYTFTGWTINGRTTTTAIATGQYQAGWRMNTFAVGCEPLTYYQDGTPRTCKPYATENGTRNSEIKVYLGGSSARPSMNVKGGWDEVTASEIEIEVDGIRTSARKVS